MGYVENAFNRHQPSFLRVFLKTVDDFWICSAHGILYADTKTNKSCLLNCKLFEMVFPSLGAPWSSNYVALFLLSDQMSEKFKTKKDINYNQFSLGVILLPVLLHIKNRSKNVNRKNILKIYCKIIECNASSTFFSF